MASNTTIPVTIRTSSSTNRYPSSSDWGWYMPTIKHLYIDEDKTLKEVMEVMKKEHHFFATVKMYKVRLRQWGLSKYIKTNPEDVASLPTLLVEGGHHGTIKLASGRVVDADRLATHLQRKKGLSATASRNNQASQPANPTTINPPDIFYISEAVLADTRAYISGRPANPSPASKAGCTAIVTIFHAIRNHLQADRHDQALALLQQAPHQLYTLLRHEPPRVLEHLFMIIAHLRDIPGDAIPNTLRALLRYAAAAADTDLGWPRHHPLRRILTSFAALGGGSRGQNARAQYDLAARGWRCLAETQETQLHLTDVGASCPNDHDDVLPGVHLEDDHHDEESQWTAYRRVIAARGGGSPEVARELLHLAELERQKGRAARGGFHGDLQRLIRWTLGSVPKERGLISKYNCELCLADFSREKRRVDLAERYLRVGMDTSFEEYGDRHPYCLLCIIHLEGWIEDWAGDEKVAALQRWKTYARDQLERAAAAGMH